MAEQSTAALAAQVARMFFDRQLSKVEIASRLGISRFRIARLIDQALAQGLVRIEFRDVPVQDRDLSRTIEENWGLDLCAVTVDPGNDEPPVSSLARLAAAIVGELVGPRDVVGVAWGSTLAAVVREITPRHEPTITVVQLAGSSTMVDRDASPAEVTRLLAERLGGVLQPLLAPAYVESTELRDALLREPEIRQTYERLSSLSMAIVGIGALPKDGFGGRSSLFQSGVLSDEELQAIKAVGAVGDLILYTFDAQGRFVPESIAEHAIAIPIDQLRRVPQVIAVAGGAEKAEAIRGALSTGIINMLITDQAAARLLTVGVSTSSHSRRHRRPRRAAPQDHV
jgi:DNA-binding transcriptional regulator LsrR (DeoR family)